MALFYRLRRRAWKRNATAFDYTIEEIIDEWIRWPGKLDKVTKLSTVKNILDGPGEQYLEYVFSIAKRRSARRIRPLTETQARTPFFSFGNVESDLIRVQILLLRHKAHWTERQLLSLLDLWIEAVGNWDVVPSEESVGIFERLARETPLAPCLIDRIKKLCRLLEKDAGGSTTISGRFWILLGDDAPYHKQLMYGIRIELRILLENVPPWEAAHWSRFFSQLKRNPGSVPTKKWLAAVRDSLTPIGEQTFAEKMEKWTKKKLQNRGSLLLSTIEHKGKFGRQFMWACASFPSDRMAERLSNFADEYFTNGHLSLGGAAARTLGCFGTMSAIRRLQWLAQKHPKPARRNACERAIDHAAKRLKLTRRDIEELSVETFGLDDDARVAETIGGYVASIFVEDAQKVAVAWTNPGGRTLKSTPKPLRDRHGDDLAALRRRVKDMRRQLSIQRQRIDRLLMADPVWTFEIWRSRYLEHGFLRPFAERLVWEFRAPDGEPFTAVPMNGRAVLHDGSERPFPGGDGMVRLWHPIDADVPTVQAWRTFLFDREFRQPIRQAFREIYVLTDAERETKTYSNRFAGHFILQKPFQGLMRTRGWRSPMFANFDPGGDPTLDLPDGDHVAVFSVFTETDEFYAEVLTTEQMFFRDKDWNRTLIEHVPPRVFSEVMRDIDLFVSVASVGADPAWMDRFAGQEAWRYGADYAGRPLTPAGESRRDVLARLLPAFAIAERCTLEERYLRVRGDLAEYRIHLGSATVKMEPDDQYLCIVPASSGKRHSGYARWLLDEDHVLSMIVSKAMLLANDEKITDATILSQIRSRNRRPGR
ncbi:MAG: DUF4132 domain-containing protein [Rhodospirillaceae bacterium]|nr:DUF4132 domain-containing protein [Rhodospirillaceae bacterium]MDE0617238.1 DUF4132 domain-containing protein [Rhodospirillaceae bacterium]